MEQVGEGVEGVEGVLGVLKAIEVLHVMATHDNGQELEGVGDSVEVPHRRCGPETHSQDHSARPCSVWRNVRCVRVV